MRSSVILLTCAAWMSVGCSVALDPRMPDNVTKVPGEPRLPVAAAAHGMPEKIGSGTFTLFAIKVAPVRISNGPGEEVVMTAIKSAVERVGYRVVEPSAPDEAATLECYVKAFNFKNYTWLAPLVPTWGGIDLDLRLVSPDSQPLWQHSYSGRSWNLFYSFSSAVNSAMAKVLRDVARDVAEPDFQHACCAVPTS